MAETDILLRIRAIAEMGDAAEAAAEVRKLAAEVDKVEDSAAKVATGLPAVTSGTKNMGMAALQAGQFIDDMQYGLRGVVNNIPGLVMSLGGGMGLAGAIGIAAVAINQLVNWLGKAKDGASDAADATAGLADKIKEVADNAAANTRDDLDKQREARDLARERQEILAKPDTAGAQARAQAEAQSLANAMQVIEASETLAALMGKQISQLEAINAREELREAQRAQAAQREIDAELAKVAAVQLTAAAARDKLAAEDAQNRKAAENLTNLNAQLEVLRAQRKAQEDIVNAAVPTWAAGGAAMTPGGTPTTNTAINAPSSSAIAAAESSLQNINAQIAAVEANIGEFEREFDGTAKATERLKNRVIAADKTVTETIGAAETKIQSITETLTASDFKAKADTAVEASKQLTKNAEEFLRTVETDGKELTGTQEKAKENLKGLLSDGKIIAEEQAALSADMLALSGATKASFDKLHSLFLDSDKLMRSISERTAELQRAQAGTARLVEDLRMRVP